MGSSHDECCHQSVYENLNISIPVFKLFAAYFARIVASIIMLNVYREKGSCATPLHVFNSAV